MRVLGGGGGLVMMGQAIFPCIFPENQGTLSETGSQQTATTAKYINPAHDNMGFFVSIISATINLTIKLALD